jgi:hypothetical protein
MTIDAFVSSIRGQLEQRGLSQADIRKAELFVSGYGSFPTVVAVDRATVPLFPGGSIDYHIVAVRVKGDS